MTTHITTPLRPGTKVHANGIDIHYVEQGEGEPFVLLHGGLVSTGPLWHGVPVAYVSQMDQLAQHFRVIAPDTRGSGATVHRAGTASMSVLADDVLAFFATLGLDGPLVCGFSEGGTTATILAIRNPDAVRAVVNDAGFDVFDPHSPQFAMARVMLGGSPEAAAADPDAAVALFTEHGMGPILETLRRDYDDAQGEGAWRRYFVMLFPRWTNSPDYTFDDFQAITAPTLILTGDRDPFCSVEDAAWSLRHLRNGELAVIPNHDHSISDAAMATSIEFLLRHAQS